MKAAAEPAAAYTYCLTYFRCMKKSKTMITIKKDEWHELRDFLILWSTQSVSQLGSSITVFALTLWLYEKTGSSLGTAALTICSYAPYVLMSIFAGALTDRFDKKKTMLGCDVFAAICTILVFVLFRTNCLAVWHLLEAFLSHLRHCSFGLKFPKAGAIREKVYAISQKKGLYF